MADSLPDNSSLSESAAAETAGLTLGTILDSRYLLESVIATSAMATVFRAKHILRHLILVLPNRGNLTWYLSTCRGRAWLI